MWFKCQPSASGLQSTSLPFYPNKKDRGRVNSIKRKLLDCSFLHILILMGLVVCLPPSANDDSSHRPTGWNKKRIRPLLTPSRIYTQPSAISRLHRVTSAFHGQRRILKVQAKRRWSISVAAFLLTNGILKSNNVEAKKQFWAREKSSVRWGKSSAIEILESTYCPTLLYPWKSESSTG